MLAWGRGSWAVFQKPKLIQTYSESDTNFRFACFASKTPALCSAIPLAPVKNVARLCLILLYSVIFVLVLCLTNIGFVQYFSFGSRKVSYALLLRLALVRTLFCVFCLTNTGFVQCYSLGSRQVRCMLVFILLYSVIFCFACFASPTSGLCSAFPFGSPFGFLCFIQFAFVMRALPNKLRFVQ